MARHGKDGHLQATDRPFPHGPVDTVLPDFQPPELGDNTFLCKPPMCGALYTRPSKLRHPHTRVFMLTQACSGCVTLDTPHRLQALARSRHPQHSARHTVGPRGAPVRMDGIPASTCHSAVIRRR